MILCGRDCMSHHALYALLTPPDCRLEAISDETATEIAAKGGKKGKGELKKKAQEEIEVQRMSSEVQGNNRSIRKSDRKNLCHLNLTSCHLKILLNLVKSTLQDKLKKIWYAIFSLVGVAHLAKR